MAALSGHDAERSRRRLHWQQETEDQLPTLKVVYLFAGASRRGDIRQHLQELAKDQFHLELKELDLEQHRSHDLSKTQLWDEICRD